MVLISFIMPSVKIRYNALVFMCKLNKVSAEARKERGKHYVYENVFS